MPLTLCVAALLAVSAPEPGPLPLAAAAPEVCWSEPLKLTLPEVAVIGRLQEQVARNHCLSRTDAALTRHLRGSYTIGKTRLGKLQLFGEELGVGFNVVVVPGSLGMPDRMYTVPALDLPEPWLRAIDKATYPVLIVGGTALLTTVILQLAR